MILVEASDRRDPSAGGNPRRASGIHRLNVRDGVRVLQRRVVPGSIAHQHDVVVVVDDAGHDRASLQVDHLRALALMIAGTLTDLGEPSVLDGHLRHDAVRAVHRVDLAVPQDEIGSLGRHRGIGGHAIGGRREPARHATERRSDARRDAGFQNRSSRDRLRLHAPLLARLHWAGAQSGTPPSSGVSPPVARDARSPRVAMARARSPRRGVRRRYSSGVEAVIRGHDPILSMMMSAVSARWSSSALMARWNCWCSIRQRSNEGPGSPRGGSGVAASASWAVRTRSSQCPSPSSIGRRSASPSRSRKSAPPASAAGFGIDSVEDGPRRAALAAMAVRNVLALRKHPEWLKVGEQVGPTQRRRIPVLMLIARGDDVDCIVGARAGGGRVWDVHLATHPSASCPSGYPPICNLFNRVCNPRVRLVFLNPRVR